MAEEEKLEDLLAGTEGWPSSGDAGLAGNVPPMPGGAALPGNTPPRYVDPDGRTTRVIPETARELSLVERFAAYAAPVRARLLAFEKRKDFLSDVFAELEARTSGSSAAYPSDYDEYLKKMLRRV